MNAQPAAPRTALRLGTRRSPLALAQAQWVADRLEGAGAGPVELVGITTEGDRNNGPLAQIGGTGVFVSALRDAVLAGTVDAAVHSLKDLPVVPAAGLVLAAVPAREDPSDVLVTRDGQTLRDLPSGSRIGTGSPRRAMQMRQLRSDLEVVDVRGNIDTRIALVHDGRLDAVVLARAGLSRLGRLDVISEVFDSDRMLPAPGQGALAVECRADVGEVADVFESISRIDDPNSRTCVVAERAVLLTLEAGCSAPVGALAVLESVGSAEAAGSASLVMHAVVGTPEGAALRLSERGPAHDPEALGRELAQKLLQAGSSGADMAWGVRVQ